MEEITLTGLIALMGIPSAITGFCFWLLQRSIIKQQAKKDKEEEARRNVEAERERLREKQELLLIQGVRAAIALGEATAKAVQRIPDAHCNGDMHKALNYADKVKHEQKDFLAEQGVHFLYE
jgi:hypothetical protein